MRRSTPHLLAALSLIALATISCTPPPPSVHGEAGFKEAYFGTDLLNGVMGDDGCTTVRFYNARRDRADIEGTAMVIPVGAEGNDLYEEAGRRYTYYRVLKEDRVITNLFLEHDAEASTDWVEEAHENTYAGNFPVDVVAKMLEVEGCNALRATPERTKEGNWTIRLAPVYIKAGDATVLGDETVQAVCGEPCPVYCGKMPALYVHCRP